MARATGKAKIHGEGVCADKVPQVMQMEALECGAACLAMICAYYGKWLSIETVRRDCGVERVGAQRHLPAKSPRPGSYRCLRRSSGATPQASSAAGRTPAWAPSRPLACLAWRARRTSSGPFATRPRRLSYNGPLVARLAPALTIGVSLVGTILIYCSSVAAQVSVSQYMAFTSAFGMLLGAFGQLGSAAGTIAQIRPQLENARPIFEKVPETASATTVISHPTGSIELTEVSFAYEGSSRPVLEHLSLSIRPGEYVAIVCASGCGKSTIMRLMLGFERPQQGTVCYDGHDLANVDVHDLRRHIGVVLQETQLFRGDLYSNIVISAPWLGEEDAWRAAEAAGIADDIRTIPMGMHAIVSEGGAGFSGGQR